MGARLQSWWCTTSKFTSWTIIISVRWREILTEKKLSIFLPLANLFLTYNSLYIYEKSVVYTLPLKKCFFYKCEKKINNGKIWGKIYFVLNFCFIWPANSLVWSFWLHREVNSKSFKYLGAQYSHGPNPGYRYYQRINSTTITNWPHNK